jgi:hypothetical protein
MLGRRLAADGHSGIIAGGTVVTVQRINWATAKEISSDAYTADKTAARAPDGKKAAGC